MNIPKDRIIKFVREKRVITSSELAKFLKISWNTAEKYLLELLIENKIERIKKEGVNLWLLKF
ncbi:MAG: DUF977 family protein [Candidatus Nanoarchaeia archaeon]|nr:DUF977 family protein [Candidatus Nanoarchaeia archaeon]